MALEAALVQLRDGISTPWQRGRSCPVVGGGRSTHRLRLAATCSSPWNVVCSQLSEYFSNLSSLACRAAEPESVVWAPARSRSRASRARVSLANSVRFGSAL